MRFNAVVTYLRTRSGEYEGRPWRRITVLAEDYTTHDCLIASDLEVNSLEQGCAYNALFELVPSRENGYKLRVLKMTEH